MTDELFQHQVAQTITFLVLSLRSPLCSKTDFSTKITISVQTGSKFDGSFLSHFGQMILSKFSTC